MHADEEQEQECSKGEDCPRCPGWRDRSQCSIWIWPLQEPPGALEDKEPKQT